ncbi:MAG: hypothetical protein OXE81_04270 [Gammaproteobacteria bacterium]|nr:hypothetical protein [Gammaproteobacteria bacterium]
MKFQELLATVGERPCFSVRDLMVPREEKHALRVQLKRWCDAGKISRIRKGLYGINAPWCKTKAPLCILDLYHEIEYGSWVSGETALSHYGVIPDTAFQLSVYGVNVKPRHEYFDTDGLVSMIDFRRAPLGLSFGCQYVPFGLDNTRYRLYAEPEKALLDCAYRFSYCCEPAWIEELRLDYLLLNKETLANYAKRMNRRMIEFAHAVGLLIDEELAWERDNPNRWIEA